MAKLLAFDKKETRAISATFRLKATTIRKLEEIAKHYDVSRADVIERLIEAGYEELKNAKKK